MTRELERAERDIAVTWSGSQNSSDCLITGKSSQLILDLPAAFTGTTLTFYRKLSDGAYSQIYQDGEALDVTVPGSTKCSVVLPADALFGVGTLRITSDQSETVASGANLHVST